MKKRKSLSSLMRVNEYGLLELLEDKDMKERTDQRNEFRELERANVDVNQDIFEEVLVKLERDKNSGSIKDLQKIILMIQMRLYSSDPILKSLSQEKLLRNMDYILRSYVELVLNKNAWGTESQSHIFSNLMAACDVLRSEERKDSFIRNNLFLSNEINYTNNLGAAEFRFFEEDEKFYLLVQHVYGRSIMNSVEEIVEDIQNNYLRDYGFNILNDAVTIMCKDKGSYHQVEFNVELGMPEWRELVPDEIIWFESRLGSLADETEVHSQFFGHGRPYEGYKAIRRIFADAKNELFIIDQFIDPSLFSLLETLPEELEIKLLTKKFQADSKNLAETFKGQRKSFQYKQAKEVHDRYIFTDQKVYLLGSSINSFAKKATTLIPIKEESLAQTIRNYANSLWEEIV